MAASEFFAAAIAAFFAVHPTVQPALEAASDVQCRRALSFHSVAGAPMRFEALRPRLLAPAGCADAARPMAVVVTAAREWLFGIELPIAPDAGQPRATIATIVLEDPADADPIYKLARLTIEDLREADPDLALDRKQLLCLQRALYFEARGEGVLGQAAVAHVALNRVGTRPSRSTVCDVVREPGQFAPYLGGEPDAADLAQNDEDATQRAMEIAAQVMAGVIPDASKGGQYFYAPRIVKTPPAWVKGLKETARIGKHRFFAEPEVVPVRDTRVAKN